MESNKGCFRGSGGFNRISERTINSSSLLHMNWGHSKFEIRPLKMVVSNTESPGDLFWGAKMWVSGSL